MVAPVSAVRPVLLGQHASPILPMAHGGSWYARDADDGSLLAAMDAAYAAGIRHFDTAAGYGGGRSEQLLGRFIADKRPSIFLASKAHTDELTADAIIAQVEGSLRRLAVETIDLYYIHWPRAGRDMRPLMEGLEQLRAAGKVGAIGVSNFTVEQMQQVAEVGFIDAHQLGYNLLWRYAEAPVIPYCMRHDIAIVAYSPLAHGILTGKFGRELELAPGDQRHSILPFRADIWPHVHAGVEELKQAAADLGLPLSTLAIRWILSRAGINSVVVGARTADQSRQNAAALAPTIAGADFERLTTISDRIGAHVPDVGNLFNHYP